jgi:3-hydroxyacyl-CoA dehydrogenase
LLCSIPRLKCLDLASKDKADCVVLTGEGKSFSAGADISEFSKNLHNSSPSLREVIQRLDEYDKPLVAYVNGVALGGGLETALACHYRVAAGSASCGLPEVHLGLLPGKNSFH